MFCCCSSKRTWTEVTLVDKNYVVRSGCSVYAAGMLVFNPDWGDDLDAWLEQFSRVGEYLVDRSWAKILLRESYKRHRDLVSWGVPYYKNVLYATFVREPVL